MNKSVQRPGRRCVKKIHEEAQNNLMPSVLAATNRRKIAGPIGREGLKLQGTKPFSHASFKKCDSLNRWR